MEHIGRLKLSTTPDGTPPGSVSPKKIATEPSEVKDMTPPDSRYVIQGPLVIDASVSQDLSAEDIDKAGSPADVVKPQLPEDPFFSSPIEQVQAIPNPSAMPNQHILSLINANLAHSRDASSSMPRPDRLGQPVSAHNAQGLFPARAVICVFNLSNLKTKDQLQVSVENIFGVFGNCYVKIKSDLRHQPNAIIQYELIADAEKALQEGNGSVIDGRVVRIEKGNVPRSMIISLLNNMPFSDAQVRDALVQHGQIESVTPTGPAMFDGQGSMAYVVKFEFFEDCKDALKIFRNNSVWRAVPAPKEKRITPYPLAAPRTPQGALYEDNDNFSIFLGSLPDSVTEEEVRGLFQMFGTIETVNIISKPMTSGGMNTFAFVSFKYAEDAQSAANSSQYLRGEKIRVEHKRYAQRRAARVLSALGPIQQMGAPQTPQYPRNTTAVGIGMGMGMGMSMAPYHQNTPYNTGNRAFTASDYHTTPPTPVFMVPYGQYASPSPMGPQMRRESPYQGAGHFSQPMQFAAGPPHNPNTFGPGPVNLGAMNSIPEERDGAVFD